MLALRTVLTAAEQHVDWQAHNDHIEARRAAVERHAKAGAKAVALTAADLGIPGAASMDGLERQLFASLRVTAEFGYAEARREITAMRGEQALAYSVPDAGEFSQAARGGLETIRALLRRRARDAAHAIGEASRLAASAAATDLDEVAKRVLVTAAAYRALHSHVLELVGETLNLGRTAGALSFPAPPEFAMRSEQLDKNTCDVCTSLHGEIAQLDTPEFYALSPPADCLGGGRCRGIWVFGDSYEAVSIPKAA